VKGVVIEYCWLYNFQASGSAGESGPVYFSTSGDTAQFTVQYNKLGITTTVGGAGTNENHSCVGLYGGANLLIQNNEMSQCYQAVRFKVSSSQVPNGNRVINNYIHDCNNGITDANGGEGPGPNGLTVSNNVFGWQNLNNSLWISSPNCAFNDFQASKGTTTSQNITFSNNTVGSVGWSYGMVNIQTEDMVLSGNVFLCGNPVCTGDTAAQGSGGGGGFVSSCDYNAYFSASNFSLAWENSSYNITSFAAWQSAYTTYPSVGTITANPDAHGKYIPNLSGYTTIAANYPNYATDNYTLVSGSPLNTASSSGGAIGANMATVGPGW
jgi:hypothetical protein